MNKTRFYMAARYGRHEEIRRKAFELESLLGWEGTGRWYKGDHDYLPGGKAEEGERFAHEDWWDLNKADLVICFTEHPGAQGRGRGGRHVEMGMAIALHKVVYIVGPIENVFSFMVTRRFDDWTTFVGEQIWLASERAKLVSEVSETL